MADRSEASFWDHLNELRGVLIRMLVVVAVLGVAAFVAMPWIFDHVIMWPASADFPLYRMFDSMARTSGVEILPGDTSDNFAVRVVSLELTSQFFIHMSAACWLAVIVGFPILVYLLWTFVEPALYENEKRGSRRAFIVGNFMFFLGAAVGYFIVFPIAVRFLADYRLSESIDAVVSLNSYMDNFFTIVLLMGAVFELPLVAWMLGRIGLLKRNFFKTYRRHAIVALLILAAVITPTGDPFSLFAVFLPIYALWEMSAHLVPREDAE